MTPDPIVDVRYEPFMTAADFFARVRKIVATHVPDPVTLAAILADIDEIRDRFLAGEFAKRN